MPTDAKTKPQTEAIDRRFLELSQFTNARTASELARDKEIGDLREMANNLCWHIEGLPASEQQTKISLMASDICRRLNELLP